ncbi:hypothetical protein CTRI78_v003614 [Colletotrichum trifolii]|uniref:Uncharacterized protein n=1 Tax=Colletotrichum trifolii TaxID=5466 RepID=A0A4R8RJ13_COLTR|nr:hypothetical protein CTRI78_v003614 [Colletotrichum trifolii]
MRGPDTTLEHPSTQPTQELVPDPICPTRCSLLSRRHLITCPCLHYGYLVRSGSELESIVGLIGHRLSGHIVRQYSVNPFRRGQLLGSSVGLHDQPGLSITAFRDQFH